MINALAAVTLVALAGTDVNLNPDPETHSARLVGTHRTLEYVTEGSLLVTAGLGVITALNKGTLLTEGNCNGTNPNPIFGNYGCNYLNIVHGGSAVVSFGLFTATEVMGAILRGNGTLPPRTGVAKYAGYASWALMALQPLLGLIAAYPGIVGVADRNSVTFSKDLRTVHAGLGVALVVAYGLTVAFEETPGAR